MNTFRASPHFSLLYSKNSVKSGGTSLGEIGVLRSRLLYVTQSSVIFFPSRVKPVNTNAILSGDFCEYEVSTPQEKRTKSIFRASSSVMMFLSCKSNTRPVARPRRPKILFLYSFEPFGAPLNNCVRFSAVSPALSSKVKYQCTQFSLGSSQSCFKSSSGVPPCHRASGRQWLMYSA